VFALQFDLTKEEAYQIRATPRRSFPRRGGVRLERLNATNYEVGYFLFASQWLEMRRIVTPRRHAFNSLNARFSSCRNLWPPR